jgi:hypothetical protein
MQSVDLIRYWRESFARVQPFTFLDDPLKAIHQIEVIRGEDLQPSRRFIRSVVLQAERHSFVVHFPLSDRVPLEHHHLALERAVFSARVQFDPRASHGDDHVPVLAGIAGAVGEDDFAIAGEFAG